MNKLDEYGLFWEVEFYEINEDMIICFRKIFVSFFRMIYSILDVLGIVVKIFFGNIVVIGDFKFDFIFVGELVNLYKMVCIGEEGVLCFLFDSINVEILIFIKLEKMIGYFILKIFLKIEGCIIFVSFVFNIFCL